MTFILKLLTVYFLTQEQARDIEKLVLLSTITDLTLQIPTATLSPSQLNFAPPTQKKPSCATGYLLKNSLCILNNLYNCWDKFVTFQ